MTDDELNNIYELAGQAKGGTWVQRGNQVSTDIEGPAMVCVVESDTAAFMVAAQPSKVRELVEDVRRLKAEVKHWIGCWSKAQVEADMAFTPEYFKEKMEDVRDEANDEIDRLTFALHKRQVHPDFEYKITETARKAGDDGRPEGDGWERNEIISCHLYENGEVKEEKWRNWIRHAWHEDNYWRRKKK